MQIFEFNVHLGQLRFESLSATYVIYILIILLSP